MMASVPCITTRPCSSFLFPVDGIACARSSSPDYSRSSSRGAVSRGECKEKDDMAVQHIGQYVSKDMAFFDEAGARLTAPQ